MPQDLKTARTFLASALESPENSPLRNPSAKMGGDGPIEVYYAPFDYVESRAKLVVVGITPGLTQAVNAITAAREAIRSGDDLSTALYKAKLTASFSGGAIRSNLIDMLDKIGVAQYFGVESTSNMFRPGAKDVHFTSALRYPVFVSGKNYSGNPDMFRVPILREMIDRYLAEEAQILSNALWLPLGPKAEAALKHLARSGKLAPRHILAGLPHPSGANAERVAVFLGRKAPEEASIKTNPEKLLAARDGLISQIRVLTEEYR